ncbi:MAG: molybdopterin-dependent oxidoreductase [Planctomycetales bacterium]|nr:molybdopterin-dependent oxidoreductase [Planctomycetales bacterium]
MNEPTLRIDGEVDGPCELTFADLATLDAAAQVADVSQYDPKRKGAAVRLSGLLKLVSAKSSAKYLGLHGTLDNFHASIPLAPVLDRGLLIYSLDGQPLDTKAGGPFRFLIADYAACHTQEIDECANVKFVDHIELTALKGFDNRPEDDAQHEALHRG